MLTHHSLDALNDHTLLSQFGVLVRQDHEGNANLLRHIDAIDRRQLWAKLGYPSMFAFLVSRYHMSESTAGKRIGAARTVNRIGVGKHPITSFSNKELDCYESHMARKRKQKPWKVQEPVARYSVRRRALRQDRHGCAVEFPPLGRPHRHPALASDSPWVVV